jgi:hypothetical protein
MSDPRRLLDDSGSDLERSLLDSARDDAPSPAARQKTLVALGLAGSIGATVTATTTTGAASTLLKSSASTALLKWIGAGILGGLVTVGTVAYVQPVTMGPRAAPNPAPPSSALNRPATTPSPQPDTAVEPAGSASASASAAPEAPSATPTASASAAPPPAKPAATTLTEEVASLDAAREALASGNTARALAALDEHQRKFPGGMLSMEATVLRIEALAQRGDRAGAARLGQAFLDAHPQSPHAARIRSILGVPEPASP